MGLVAYRLQLPKGVGLHLVFHISLLKKSIGPADVASSALPVPIEDMEEGEPLAMLNERVIYNDTVLLTQVLMQWSHLHPDNTTWEYLPDLLQRFPRITSLF